MAWAGVLVSGGILLPGLMSVEGGEGFPVVGRIHPIPPMEEHLIVEFIHTLGDMEFRECLFLLHLLSPDQELEFLKNQAGMLKQEMELIEARVKDLEKTKKHQLSSINQKGSNK